MQRRAPRFMVGLLASLCSGLGQPRASVRECNLMQPSETPSPSCIEGEVALSSDDCAFFVVRTKRSFMFVTHVWSGFNVAEGERVVGPLHSLGAHEIVVLAGLEHYDRTIDVSIEGEASNDRQAQQVFYSRCHERSVRR